MSKEKKEYNFPEGFLWGAATSAYQIEGGIECDWSAWEKSEKRLAFLKKNGLEPRDYICGRACDSYNKYRQDIDLLKQINCKAYRFGIEWARVEPEEGIWDDKEIKHYREQLTELKKNNIKTFVTLWHWTNPLWLEKYGFWESKKTVELYERYVDKIVAELGDLVDFWVALNEPLMIFGHGYWSGKFPPNKKRALFKGIKVSINLVKAHKAAYKKIHSKLKNSSVGLAMTSGYFDRKHKYNPLEMIMVKVADYLRNYWFLNRLKGYIDYVGVNYYHHDRLTWLPPFKDNENKVVSDFGWEIFPEGIYHVLLGYKKYNLPIYVLENGVADEGDFLRENFIKDHLYYIHKAIRDGAPVKGYFYWSLLDNFEWADGYEMKFGLCRVDRETFQRELGPSAHSYGQICLENKLVLND